LDFKRALEEGGRVRDLYPKTILYRGNYALYAMYAGDFPAAAKAARELIQDDAKAFKAYLPLAMSAVLSGTTADATSSYERMTLASPSGASVATLGLADLALYEGRLSDARKLLEAGIPEDEKTKNARGKAAKYLALAELHLALGQRADAIGAAEKAMTASFDARPRAAAMLVDAGDEKQAAAIAIKLAEEIQPQSRAHAKIIEARIALRQSRLRDAVEDLQAAIKLADLWSARYLLGVTLVEAKQWPEALAELDACQRRGGEATAVALDDLPTVRVLGPLKYWRGRAQAFLELRGGMSNDPLAQDARRRLKTL
jgi:tetratricopeptide (TPR) repeat protein